jgi:hypothetical protein
MMPSEAELLAARLVRLKTIVDSLESECAASSIAREKFAALKIEMETVRAALSTLHLRTWSDSPGRAPCPVCHQPGGLGLRDLTIMSGTPHAYCPSCGHIWKEDD